MRTLRGPLSPPGQSGRPRRSARRGVPIVQSQRGRDDRAIAQQPRCGE